jgi:hypothetical protein
MDGCRWLALVAALTIVLLPVRRAAGDGPPAMPDVLATPQSAGPGREAVGTGTAADTGSDPSSVFFVQRNKNRKEVHYGIHLDEQCRPVGDEPVYNYWLRPSKGGSVTEPLTFFQETGYGVKRQKVSSTQVEVVLKALPDRRIIVVPSSQGGRCRARAYMEIAAQLSRFEKAYVFAEEGFVLPTVKYIDLFGRAEDGTPVREHFVLD